MVLRRILSCLAMVSVVFLMSCYDVDYDKDDAAPAGKWYDGLTQADIIKWMEVTAEPAVASKDDDSVEVSWECPIDSDKWTVETSTDGETWEKLDATVAPSKTGSTVQIGKTRVDYQGYYVWKYWFGIPIPQGNIIKYFKVGMLNNNDKPMLDDNGNQVATVVSFVVLPHPATLKVTLTGADQEASSKLSFYQDSSSTPLYTKYNNVKAALAAKDVEQNVTLNACKKAYFSIESDFSFRGIADKFKFYSNTSYCKVTIQKTPNAGAAATLKYSFEDLPKDLKKLEPTAIFDYNDVVFTVDIIGNAR